MKPTREHATNNEQTYFVTTSTWQRRALFNNRRWAELFLETLQSYRGKGYLLHEYVLMPDHFHILITPTETLERSVQFVKGGFSFRAQKELGSSMEIWQRGFSDHRIRHSKDFEIHIGYIYRNPVGRGLAEQARDYPYCSAFPGCEKDEVPQWLKPLGGGSDGTAEAVPLQGKEASFRSKEPSFRNEEAPFRSKEPSFRNEEPSFQNEEASLQNEALCAKQ